MDAAAFPKIIGHRGVPHIAPENTMASFRKAAELGAEGLETDVHKTKDGKLVLIHDEKLDRTTDGTGLVGDYTLAGLERLSAGARFSPGYAKERIPTLEEFLAFASEKKLYINLELKTGIVDYPGIEEDVIAMLHRYHLEGSVILSSFNHYTLQRCKRIDPAIPTGILYMCALVEPWDYARRIGADALHPLYRTVSREVAEGARTAGIALNPSTVDDPDAMREMAELGVTGIITNFCDRLRALRDADAR